MKHALIWTKASVRSFALLEQYPDDASSIVFCFQDTLQNVLNFLTEGVEMMLWQMKRETQNALNWSKNNRLFKV